MIGLLWLLFWRLPRGALGAWGLLFLGIVLAPAACAQERSITIEDFDAAITVAESGGVEVAETIRLRFTGSWNGIHRRIPVRYTDARGENYGLRLNLLAGVAGARPREFFEISDAAERAVPSVKMS